MSSQPTIQQEMMTLAAIAYTGSTTALSGETLPSQRARISTGIRAQLQSSAPSWELKSVGLTPDRANLAFVARRRADAGTAVVALRGTVLSITDVIEDLDVLSTVSFDVGAATKGNVSRGAMEAFTGIVMGTGLRTALAAGGAPKTIYLTGHSLGGALVTMVAPYLARTFPQAQVLPFTYAAPTAGDVGFADSFNAQFASAQCLFNRYDLIPHVWALADVENLSNLMGDHQDDSVKGMILGLLLVINEFLTGFPAYAQPRQQSPLNQNYDLHFNAGTITSLEEWLAEAEFQHMLSTYLTALGAAQIAAGPVVNDPVTPASGPTGGGTIVTLTGTGLGTATNVDFGVAAGVGMSVQDSKLVRVVSPPGVGTVEVTVTTTLGTSVGVPFTYVQT